MKVAWAQEAQERLQEIEDFISRNSPEMAVRLIEKLLERGDRLASFPRAGRRVPELDSQDIREVIEGNYRIVYRLKPSRIEVLTVFEGHRQFPMEDVT